MDSAAAGSNPKKYKFVIDSDDVPSEITFITADDNGTEIRNKNLNPEFIPLDLPEEKKRKKKSWLEKKIQKRW